MKGNANHSIENALIQASSKGYTIDMILGNHDRKKREDEIEAKDDSKRPKVLKLTGAPIVLAINQF